MNWSWLLYDIREAPWHILQWMLAEFCVTCGPWKTIEVELQPEFFLLGKEKVLGRRFHKAWTLRLARSFLLYTDNTLIDAPYLHSYVHLSLFNELYYPVIILTTALFYLMTIQAVFSITYHNLSMGIQSSYICNHAHKLYTWGLVFLHNPLKHWPLSILELSPVPLETIM